MEIFLRSKLNLWNFVVIWTSISSARGSLDSANGSSSPESRSSKIGGSAGEFINGKRHGEGTFTYTDGRAYIGTFVDGKEKGVGICISEDGETVPCTGKTETQTKEFSGKDTEKISIVAKKWVRISQYETNTKKGKKIMDKLKADFEIKALELCATKGSYEVLRKNIEVLEIDETPAYGLETKLKLGINGIVECKQKG